MLFWHELAEHGELFELRMEPAVQFTAAHDGFCVQQNVESVGHVSVSHWIVPAFTVQPVPQSLEAHVALGSQHRSLFDGQVKALH